MHLLHEHAPAGNLHLGYCSWRQPRLEGTERQRLCRRLLHQQPGQDAHRTFRRLSWTSKTTRLPLKRSRPRSDGLTSSVSLHCSCCTFGLAWQLWAREEVENPHRPEDSKPARSMKKPEKARSMTPAPTPEPTPAVPGVKAEDQPIKPDELKALLGTLKRWRRQKLDAFMQAFTAVFPLPPNGRVSEAITSVKHQTWINDYFKRNG